MPNRQAGSWQVVLGANGVQQAGNTGVYQLVYRVKLAVVIKKTDFINCLIRRIYFKISALEDGLTGTTLKIKKMSRVAIIQRYRNKKACNIAVTGFA